MAGEFGALHAIPAKYGIPSAWHKGQIGDLAELVGGGTPDRAESRYWGGGIPWATPTDVTALQSRRIVATSECITEAGLDSAATRLLPAGTILYTSRATIGAIAVAGMPLCTNQGFANFLPKDGVNSDYLFHLLRFATSTVVRLGAGTTFLEVSKRDLKRLSVVIPDEPDEQRRIAAILDAADAVMERDKCVLQQVRLLRSGILQRFFRDALGPISSADRPGKEIAEGWRLVPTGKLLAEEPKNGVSPPAESQPPGTPTFSIGAVRGGRIDLTNQDHLKYVRIEDKIATKFAVHKGDILVVRGNANPGLVGKCGVIDEFPNGCIYPDILKRILFADTDDGVLPDYAAMVWNHPLVHNQVLKRAQTSNGTLKINSRDVKQIILPVPPKEQQLSLMKLIRSQEELAARIVARLKLLRSLKRGLMQDLLTGKVRVPSKVGVAGS